MDIRIKNPRGRRKEALYDKKMIRETDKTYEVQMPEENEEAWKAEILAIAGARPVRKIAFNPGGKIPEEQVTFCVVYSVPKSEENLQRIAAFGKAHRFTFDSDLSVRAWSSTQESKQLLKMSFAKSSSFKLPSFGKMKPYKFQVAGAEYALRTKRCFIADEMGLGKTIQAIITMSSDNQYPWLIVPPASLKYNWLKELRKWLKTRRFQGKALKVTFVENSHMKISKDGKVATTTKKFFKEHQVFIINYDRLDKYLDILKTVNWRGVVFDESHYLKAMNSRRSKAATALMQAVEPEYILCLSGTPLMNRPTDLCPQLRLMGRINDFGGFNNFQNRYCTVTSPDPSHMKKLNDETKKELGIEENENPEEHPPEEQDGTAAQIQAQKPESDLAKEAIEQAMIRKMYENMSDLNNRLRGLCYIRREKEDVLKDLPPKTRAMLPLEINNRETYERISQDVIGFLMDQAAKDEKFLASIKKLSIEKQKEKIAERRASKGMIAARAQAIVRISKLKLAAAAGKMAAAKEWINSYLEQGQKIVIFAHHKIILRELLDEYPTAAHSMCSAKKADEHETRFQNDPDCRVYIGRLKADGVGRTLTAASAVAFLELGWTPAAHDQAEDRIHRIGQKQACFEYYLLAKNTIDEPIAQIIERKRRIVNAVAVGDPLKGSNQGHILGELIAELTGKATLLSKTKGSKVSKPRASKKMQKKVRAGK